MNDKTQWVSSQVYHRKERFKYLDDLKVKLIRKWHFRIVPVLKVPRESIRNLKNDNRYLPIRNYVINFGCTGLIMSLLMWLFSFSQPFRKGFGIAVITASVQYYLNWFYSMRPRPPNQPIPLKIVDTVRVRM